MVNTGAATPSQESRSQVLWEEDGMLTITGGKLTIYRVMAAQALNAVSARLRGSPRFNHKMKAFELSAQTTGGRQTGTQKLGIPGRPLRAQGE